MIALLNVRKRLSGWFSRTTRDGVPQDTLPTQRPEWYMDRVADCLAHTQRMTSESNSTNLKVYQRQCEYLAKQLETAFMNSQESVDRSSSVEQKAECLDTVMFFYQVAKEVERFIGDCCSETLWMQVALTPASVPLRVCSWGWDLKLCSEVLRNSNKLGAAWLTCRQVEGVREAELVAVKEMALNDEDFLRRSLESVTRVRSNSKPNVVERDIELGSILVKRLKAKSCEASTSSSYLEAWRVEWRGLRRRGRIGWGASPRSSVYKGEWFREIKVDVWECYYDSYFEFESDLIVTTGLSHPKIVSFLGYTTIDSDFRSAIVLELMDGNLRTLMLQRMQGHSGREAPFSIWVACDIMLQVAQGIEYMHRNGIVHKHLKSSNILVTTSKEDDVEHVCAKVAGFGVSKGNENPMMYMERTQFVDIARWMAPELMRVRGDMDGLETSTSGGVLQHLFKLDVYSFGMLCFEILTGATAFENLPSRAMREEVLKGVRPDLPLRLCPQSLKNLIELCWDLDPSTRPSFAEICEELEFIRCSLLLEPLDQVDTPPVSEVLDLPGQISKFKGEYFALKVVRQLGKGGSDIVTVYLSTWLQPDVRNAQKGFIGSHNQSSTWFQLENRVAQKRFIGSHNQCFMNEVSIMAELEHPNVVRLLYYATDMRSCSIVMELMDEDLHDLMWRRRLDGNETPTGPFSMDDAIDVILQIAQGMKYVHGKNVVHRDLKSCNILVRKGIGTEGRQLEVKVADFGLSMKLKSRQRLLEKDSGVGTVRWMAPEVFNDTHDVEPGMSKYDPFKSDVYSFGMVSYEILVGRVPFYELVNLNEVRERVLGGGLPSLPEWTPFYLKVLIDKCWQRNSSRRPSFAEIVGELAQSRVETRPKTLSRRFSSTRWVKHAHVR